MVHRLFQVFGLDLPFDYGHSEFKVLSRHNWRYFPCVLRRGCRETS